MKVCSFCSAVTLTLVSFATLSFSSLAPKAYASADSDLGAGEAEYQRAQDLGALRSAHIDLGYDHLPKAKIDINGDGRWDYCRFVGNSPNIFIACAIRRRSYPQWSAEEQFSFRSISGIDPGYDTLPRGFRIVNGRVAYCRYVGNAPNIFEACNLSTSTGFSPNQFGYRTGRTSSSAVNR